MAGLLFQNYLPGPHNLSRAVGRGTPLRFPIVSSRFFHSHNTSSRTMTLGSTKPLTEMSTRYISLEGKGGRCVGPILQYVYATFIEILGASNSWSPKGMFRPVMVLLYVKTLFELETPWSDGTIARI